MYGVFFFAFIGCAFILIPVLQAFGVFPQWGISLVIFIFAISTYIFAAFRFRLLRAVRDTATSKISGLPAGFTEVCGIARRHPNFVAIYQDLRVREKYGWLKGGGRFLLRSANKGFPSPFSDKLSIDQFSCFPFYIDDGTGSVYVDPGNAKIIAGTKRWNDGDYVYEETAINDGDFIYCLGTAGRENKDINAEINEALKAARESKDFVRKYDINGDGIISQEEWDIARKKITDEVLEKNVSAGENIFTNTIKKGGENKIFIISNKHEEELTSLLFRQTAAMFAGSVFLAAVAIFDAFARLKLLPAEIVATYHSSIQFVVLALVICFFIYFFREHLRMSDEK